MSCPSPKPQHTRTPLGAHACRPSVEPSAYALAAMGEAEKSPHRREGSDELTRDSLLLQSLKKTAQVAADAHARNAYIGN